MKKTFRNSAELGFYDYMMSQREYKESTVMHYILRLRQIEQLSVLLYKNLTPYIAAFESGADRMKNTTSHGAYSSALKRLAEYQAYKGIAA